MGRVPDGFPLARWTARRSRAAAEALRLQMALPGQRELALKAAFSDADPRVVRVGHRRGAARVPAARAAVSRGLAQGERVPEDLRLLAVQALGNTRTGGARRLDRARATAGADAVRAQKLAPRAGGAGGAARAGRRVAQASEGEPLLGLAAVQRRRLREAVR
jgi:hypothetical protein